jgi:ribosomal protein S18 acetylase RimI-like enzyme
VNDEPVTIRDASLEDAFLLGALGERTFRETFVEDFARPYSERDIATFVSGAYGEGAIRALLIDPSHRHLLAWRGATAVGFALAGPVLLRHPDVRADDRELRRIYVLRDAQGTGAGRALFDAAMAWMHGEGARRVWLGVWSGNARAQRFYASRGFTKVGQHRFRIGETLDDDHILRHGA